MNNPIREMLLIENDSVFSLYKEINDICGYFVAPLFMISLTIEYFSNMNFGEVVKKLFIILIFMGAFYSFHTKAVDLSLEGASTLIKKVSPRNLFLKNWYTPKIKTKESKKWNYFESLVIPDINDLLGIAFFYLGQIFIWFLKLVYSSVYHFTYIFSGVTALLYFFGWTKNGLKGTVQSTLWCILLPYVVVAILCLVGNSLSDKAQNSELLVSSMESIIWLFGVTLLLLLSPVFTFTLIKGDGVAAAGASMGKILSSAFMTSALVLPHLGKISKGISGKMGGLLRRNEESSKEIIKGSSNNQGKSANVGNPQGKEGAQDFSKTSFKEGNPNHKFSFERKSTQEGRDFSKVKQTGGHPATHQALSSKEQVIKKTEGSPPIFQKGKNEAPKGPSGGQNKESFINKTSADSSSLKDFFRGDRERTIEKKDVLTRGNNKDALIKVKPQERVICPRRKEYEV